MSPEEPSFSRQNMGRAIEYLAPYLVPEPTAEDKKSFDYTKFQIIDEPGQKMTKFVEDHIMNATVLSLETMLLVIECLIRSSDKMKKAICRISKQDDKSSGVHFIFVKWHAYALAIIEKKRKNKSPDSFPADVPRTEELICSGVMELLCALGSVINKAKQLKVFLDKFKVDWVHIVAKVSLTSFYFHALFRTNKSGLSYIFTDLCQLLCLCCRLLNLHQHIIS